MKFILTIFIIIIFPINTLFSQTRKEALSFRETMGPAHQHDHYTFARNIDNEVDFVFSGLFLIYKKLISSQDMASCVFEPSCSVYALQSIQKKGLIVGTLMAFDRLTRCNRLSPENYHLNPKTLLLHDPVE